MDEAVTSMFGTAGHTNLSGLSSRQVHIGLIRRSAASARCDGQVHANGEMRMLRR
jgi:hypothetical protein